ncbi:Signal transduction histidine kinase [Leucobacter chromiiresistens]|uniref:histidine kinase n=1 Tax=Leucobacter chromiiresistens TaxID=1079994 RepID=A0A1H0ZDY9_9MICO|nr:Signal transduction histidine kinase [Leucobacter chromiiresistens]
MRFRVLLPLFVFGVLAVTAILIPVGAAIAESRTQELQLQRGAALQQIAQRASAALAADDPGELDRYLNRFSETFGEAVVVVDGAGARLTGSGAPVDDAAISAVISGALRGVPQRDLGTVTPWSEPNAVIAAPVTLDGRTPEGAVALQVDQQAAQRDIAAGWATIVSVGAALLFAVLLASVLWTRWVLRPVSALDTAANALAENRAYALDADAGPPELRRLSRSFARMARSVELALDQQHGLVADASHQLRNPLAAIRLRIDGLPRGVDAGGDGRDEEIAAIERDLDRLEHTVARMLALANAEHRATAAASGHGAAASEASPPASDDLPVSVSAARLIAPHLARLADAGIAVIADEQPHMLRFRRHDLAEVVELVADNVAKYAPGSTFRVELTPCGSDEGAGRTGRAGGAGPATALVMSDSGPGLATTEIALVGRRFWRAPAHAQLPGSGLGLAIVEQLARANDAEVVVDRAPTGGLRISIIAGAA